MRAKAGPLPPSFPPSATVAAADAHAADNDGNEPTYPVFAPDDSTGVLPPRLSTLVTLGAHMIGVRVEAVMRSLGALERRLVRTEDAAREAKRREKKAANALRREIERLEGRQDAIRVMRESDAMDVES